MNESQSNTSIQLIYDSSNNKSVKYPFNHLACALNAHPSATFPLHSTSLCLAAGRRYSINLDSYYVAIKKNKASYLLIRHPP